MVSKRAMSRSQGGRYSNGLVGPLRYRPPAVRGPGGAGQRRQDLWWFRELDGRIRYSAVVSPVYGVRYLALRVLR